MKKGFSLVELLISLIVISCITAAFTPLITKKFSSGVFGGGGSVSDITADCEKFGPNCNLCTSNFCLSCTGLTCNSDEYKDNKSCSCKKCVDKFGADCTKCNEDKCLTCPDGQYLDENQNCKPCTDKFSNCSSCDSTACLNCNYDYVVKNGQCEPFVCSGDDFIQIGNLCVTKKNMGDSDVLAIPNGVNIVNTGTKCIPSSTNKCCWKGNTANMGCNNDNGSQYSGCNRTACDFYAAKYICENFNYAGRTWSLPASNETTINNWHNCSINQGLNGLQLCDQMQGYLSAWCNWSDAATCNGSKYSRCYVNALWTKDNSSTNSYECFLTLGNWTCSSSYPSDAFSIRCVTPMSQSCESKYGAGCLSCNNTQCLSCDSNNGYLLRNGKCKSTFCKGSDFMLIGNLCVTRKNMGDSTTLKIPSGVNVVNKNNSCSSFDSNKCCWNGNTAGANCDNENGGGYSGCNRTVCNGWAANYICSNFRHGDRVWRLPTVSEMNNWNIYSSEKGLKGLQLCDYNKSQKSAWCHRLYGCFDTLDDYCSSNVIWTGNSTSATEAYIYNLDSSTSLIWFKDINNLSLARSVRCVTEL